MALRAHSNSPPGSPALTRSLSKAMAEENHPSQNEPETVPLADHIALQREVENLQAMVWATIIQNPPPIQNNTGAVPLSVIPNSPKGIDPIINQKIKHLEEALKAMQGPNAYPSTKFLDLYFFPNQPLPAKFKIPDFTKFNGTTDPMTHLRLYVRALNGLPNPNKLMMQLFQYSLIGPAAQWFARLDLHRSRTWAELSQEFVKQYRHNVGIGINRMHLLRMEQELEETFRAYALHWKNSTAQVEPPLLDHEYVHLFVQTLEGIYYEKLCSSIGRSFLEII
ncbi:hypothetical protein Vadar_002678 [Vaccinium darrowii]|uniref:Uncharacterized protein n=1 Tax=Vaccinium darrowii TaxID=229202 RepID=A0ACB7Y4F6_9ERIC|nr:hypothetical protein Vadar_002678 [Vaccinium darrowii]